MKYRIMEEDRNSETLTRDNPLAVGQNRGESQVFLMSDSGQVINWRYVRRLVPMENGDPA